jgi:hypothetical protein
MGVHALGPNYVVFPKNQAVQLDDQQRYLFKAAGCQSLQLVSALFDKPAADELDFLILTLSAISGITRP